MPKESNRVVSGELGVYNMKEVGSGAYGTIIARAVTLGYSSYHFAARRLEQEQHTTASGWR